MMSVGEWLTITGSFPTVARSLQRSRLNEIWRARSGQTHIQLVPKETGRDVRISTSELRKLSENKEKIGENTTEIRSTTNQRERKEEEWSGKEGDGGDE